MNSLLKSQKRRDFLKKGAAGLAGAAFMSSFGSKGKRISASPSPQGRKLIFRTLGRTGIKLPVISIGAVSEDAGLYRTALDSGITHIDTSQYYFNGRHERVVGEAVKGRPRDSFVIATSMLLGNRESARHSFLLLKDADKMAEKFESSLERMGLDYVDIFYVAGVGNRENTLHEGLVEGVQKLKKDGKAKFIGVATHQGQVEVLKAAVELGIHDVALVSYNFRMKNKEDVGRAITEAAAAGMGIVVMKPMAGAYWDRERKQPINGKAALKWILQNENVHSIIPGISTLDQLEGDLSIMENPTLTPEEIRDLKLEGAGESGGLYCQQCGECSDACPSDLDIPVMMRSYMYAYGYQDLGRARGALDQIDPSAIACRNCASCSISCPQGFTVKTRILDIARLLQVPESFLC